MEPIRLYVGEGKVGKKDADENKSINLVLIDPATYTFYNASMARNNDTYRFLPGQYSTDLVAKAAVGFLDDGIAGVSERPFFLGVAPIAPHSESPRVSGVVQFKPPVPAKRHEHLFPNAKVPRTPGFNPDKVSRAVVFLLMLQVIIETLLLTHRNLSQAQRPTSRRFASSTKAK